MARKIMNISVEANFRLAQGAVVVNDMYANPLRDTFFGVVNYEYHQLTELLSHLKEQYQKHVAWGDLMFDVTGEGRVVYIYHVDRATHKITSFLNLWIKEEENGYWLYFSESLYAHM